MKYFYSTMEAKHNTMVKGSCRTQQLLSMKVISTPHYYEVKGG